VLSFLFCCLSGYRQPPYSNEGNQIKSIFLDLCTNETTTDTQKGTFHWLLTDLGARRYTRCPYAFDSENTYGTRDCLFGCASDESEINTPQWMKPNLDECSLPQISRVIASLHDKIVNIFSVKTNILIITFYRVEFFLC